GTDDALEVDAHGGVVDGGLERLAGAAQLLFRRFPDGVVVHGIEGEGGGHLLGLGGVRGECADEVEGDRLAGLVGGSGLLSGLGHDRISLTLPEVPRAPCLRLSSSGAVRTGLAEADGVKGAERDRSHAQARLPRRAWRGPPLSSPADARPRTRTKPRGRRRQGACAQVGTLCRSRSWLPRS